MTEGVFFRQPQREQINLMHPAELRITQGSTSNVAAPDCRAAVFAARI